MDEADKDKDGFLSLEEFLGKWLIFIHLNLK